MPVCPQCDNRQFSNKEALLQHMKSSSSWHPFCSHCERRFVSQTAYDAHMAAKHPPTFDCTSCNRSFSAAFALEDHYRGSSAHPNCVRCGRGFCDNFAVEQHVQTAHHQSPCEPCGGAMIYDEDSERELHYRNSENHPTCNFCGRGLENEEIYKEHLLTEHPAPTDLPAGAKTPSKADSPPPPPEAPQELSRTISSTGFTPLSPKSRMQSILIGERVKSPELRLEAAFMSPILEAKQLPPPAVEIEEFWKSRKNVEVSAGKPSSSQPEYFARENETTSPNYLVRPASSSRSSTSTSSMSMGNWLHGSESFLPREPRTTRLSIPPLNPDFSNSRLYPGIVRHTIRNGMNLSEYPLMAKIEAAESNQLLSHLNIDSQTSKKSPQLATISSPSSSFLGNFPEGWHGDVGRRTTSKVCALAPTAQIQYSRTPNSQVGRPRSPEVASPSPGDFGALPFVSPLISSPINYSPFDIAEAHKPLPDSPPESSSPHTVVLDLKPHELEIPIASGSPQSDSSYITSPQEIGDTTLTNLETPVTLLASPVIIPDPPPKTTPKLNPLRCRVCMAESCDDITASMCGHIFCNRCITDAVIKTSRCPVCMTPTLLYCLFRLDLAD